MFADEETDPAPVPLGFSSNSWAQSLRPFSGGSSLPFQSSCLAEGVLLSAKLALLLVAEAKKTSGNVPARWGNVLESISHACYGCGGRNGSPSAMYLSTLHFRNPLL